MGIHICCSLIYHSARVISSSGKSHHLALLFSGPHHKALPKAQTFFWPEHWLLTPVLLAEVNSTTTITTCLDNFREEAGKWSIRMQVAELKHLWTLPLCAQCWLLPSSSLRNDSFLSFALLCAHTRANTHKESGKWREKRANELIEGSQGQ